MTGYGRESDRAMAKRVGFDEHLVKPVSADDLLRLLGEEEAADTYADTSASR